MTALRTGRATLASLILCSLFLCSFVACTWVPVTPAGQLVRPARSAAELEGCELVGAVTAQTKSRVGILARSEEKIGQELQALARNDAAEMGANRIVAEGPPSVDGRQRFSAYRCASSN